VTAKVVDKDDSNKSVEIEVCETYYDYKTIKGSNGKNQEDKCLSINDKEDKDGFYSPVFKTVIDKPSCYKCREGYEFYPDTTFKNDSDNSRNIFCSIVGCREMAVNAQNTCLDCKDGFEKVESPFSDK